MLHFNYYLLGDDLADLGSSDFSLIASKRSNLLLCCSVESSILSLALILMSSAVVSFGPEI